MQTLWHEFAEQARALGFAQAWVTGVERFSAWEQAVAQRGDGHGQSLSADPKEILPCARRIIVLAYPYQEIPSREFPKVRISPYYFASQRVHQCVPQLADWLRARGWQAVERPSLPAKPAAQRAGLGVYGANGLIQTPTHGSRIVLALLVTDAELPLTGACEQAEEKKSAEGSLNPACKGCGACVRACPVGALDGTSAVDTSRCLRAYMLYDKPVPEAFRPTMGNRLLGCDLCQQACPNNHRAAQHAAEAASLELTAGLEQAVDLELDDLLAPAETFGRTMSALGTAVGKNYARPQRILAQVALLAGNSGDRKYLAALQSLCESENPVVREHARWASAQLGAKHEPK